MSLTTVDSGPLHVKPVIDLNLATEASRILHILNTVISRAKFAGLLRLLVKDDAYLLKDVVDPNLHFYILQTCDKYHYTMLERLPSSIGSFDLISQMSLSHNTNDTEDKSSDEDDDDDDDDAPNTFSTVSSSQSRKFENKGKDRFDEFLSKVINLLEENKDVQKMLKSLERDLTLEMKFFIKCLTEFKNRMEARLTESAAQYRNRENYMRELYEKNEKIQKEIEKLEDELVVTKTGANVCLVGRNILINRHQKNIEKIQQGSQETIEKKVKESEKLMVNDWKNSMVVQERLKTEYEEASDRYANLLKEHLSVEKVLRAKRNKVENQVLGWIQKFDQDIGEKQAEEEQIQALLDEEMRQVMEIQGKLDEQEEEYDELMQEKAEYEEEMLERRLYRFIVNRSARRIQRTFRLYKARKLAKKLGKKGKKGKKKKGK